MRSLVTDFIGAARSSASWHEASDFLASDLMDVSGNPTDQVTARKLQICKRFFEMGRRRKQNNSTNRPQ
jgi:hypothetical protein